MFQRRDQGRPPRRGLPDPGCVHMRWVAIFDDDPGRDAVRKEHSAAHFAYLAANRLFVWGKAPCYDAVSL